MWDPDAWRDVVNDVSMKSGLEGRNNFAIAEWCIRNAKGLNEVRPRRPEQFVGHICNYRVGLVSMKSGLEGRNNRSQSL